MSESESAKISCERKVVRTYQTLITKVEKYFKDKDEKRDDKEGSFNDIVKSFIDMINTKPCTKELIYDRFLNLEKKQTGLYDYVTQNLQRGEGEAEEIVTKIKQGIDSKLREQESSNGNSGGGSLEGSVPQPSSSNNDNGKCINCTEGLSKTIEGLTGQVTKSAEVLNKLNDYEKKLKDALKDKIRDFTRKWSTYSDEEREKRAREINDMTDKSDECEKACKEQMKKLQDQTDRLRAAMEDLGKRFDSKEHIDRFVTDVTSGFADIENKPNMGRVVASAFGISHYKKSKKSKK